MVIILALLALLAVNPTSADEGDDEGFGPLVHIVAWGDTLSQIARRYDVPVEAIIAANNLTSPDQVYAGQLLIIPRTAGQPRTAGGAASSHTVQPGETLYALSLLYGVSMENLIAANGLQEDGRIYTGQVLTIPGTDAPAPSSPPRPPATPSGGTYTVKAGDTLSAIARIFNLSAADLAVANGLLNPSQIYTGQILTIPGAPNAASAAYAPQEASSTHVVQAGETLTGIASRYGVSPWVLAQANSISNPSLVYSGQVLTIPGRTALTTTPPSPASRKAIVVDVSEQRAYVYENDQLLWTFVVSTGLPGLDTWRGEYTIQNKLPMAYASTWGIQMPYWMGIYWAGPLQNGFHALPIQPNGSRLWEGYLGTPVSYGCIILSDQDAQTLYSWAEIGTYVRVQN
ncbi:MAG: hypothetical protein Kow00124_02930 [Anaerolineae bacterium]